MATNKNRTGIIIISVVAVIIIVAVLYIYRDKFFGPNCDPSRNGFDKKGNPNPKCLFADPKNTNEPAPTGSGGWVSDTNFPIKKGSWGPKVAALQKAIGAGVDGKFGPKTEAALKAKTGKTQVDTQAEYDKIITPNPVGGNNFDNVKAALGASGTTTSDSVYTVIKGENTPYTVTFYTNSRVAFRDDLKNTYRKGSYKNGGREIVIDANDGGYATGNWISNSDVFQSMRNIIAKIEG